MFLNVLGCREAAMNSIVDIKFLFLFQFGSLCYLTFLKFHESAWICGVGCSSRPGLKSVMTDRCKPEVQFGFEM